MRWFYIFVLFISSEFVFAEPANLFSPCVAVEKSDSLPKDTADRLGLSNSLYTSIFFLVRSHLGYERKLVPNLSIGTNLFYYNFSTNQYFDYKGEFFLRHYFKNKGRYLQLKGLVGLHKKSDELGCTTLPQEDWTYGAGVNWGRKKFLGKKKLYIEWQFGFKYYRFPFYYHEDTPHCESDYERIFYIGQRNWYLFYPGSFVEWNVITGYAF